MSEPSPIAIEILAHVVGHPNAQDTIEGLVEWWLLERRIAEARLEVRLALTELVGRGLMIEAFGADGRARYKLHQDKLDEARRLVEHAGLS